ncbi:MAG: PTS sugar transporter subunit IIA, partial [Bullifex sp.]
MDFRSTVTILPEGIDKFAAFGEIIRNCDVFDILDDKDKYLEAVIKREKLQSTGIGHSTTIAHGKIPHLAKTTVALGISRDGIIY